MCFPFAAQLQWRAAGMNENNPASLTEKKHNLSWEGGNIWEKQKTFHNHVPHKRFPASLMLNFPLQQAELLTPVTPRPTINTNQKLSKAPWSKDSSSAPPSLWADDRFRTWIVCSVIQDDVWEDSGKENVNKSDPALGHSWILTNLNLEKNRWLLKKRVHELIGSEIAANLWRNPWIRSRIELKISNKAAYFQKLSGKREEQKIDKIHN